METSHLDQLPISVVKSRSAEFSAIIAHIANTSFKADHFPSAWKAGLIVLLLKKSGLDTNDFKSFRPVTNLVTLSKLLTANPDACIDRLESCSAGLQRWFCENDLFLNPDKSEVCYFSTRQTLRHADKPLLIKFAGCYSAPRVWNSIPRSLRDVRTTSGFKTGLKTYLFDSTSVTK